MVVANLVLAIDMAPTVLQLAGVAVPPTMDGRSWVPLLQPTTPVGGPARPGLHGAHS